MLEMGETMIDMAYFSFSSIKFDHLLRVCYNQKVGN